MPPMRPTLVLLAVALVLALAAPAGTTRAAATTFTVTKTADTNDGVCDTDCSLREAIAAANANAGKDTIAFDIPGAGTHTIQPTSALPSITDPVVIDGYTQPGASPNTNGPGLGLNTVLKIELDGTSAGASVDGLKITAGTSTVRGLVINRFGSMGVRLDSNGGNVIEGNFIGTDVTGMIDLGNALDGVKIFSDASDSTIGGTTAEARNIISGNDNVGVFINFTTGTIVQGNFIGTDVTGTVGLGNAFHGVVIQESSGTTVGGTAPGARNVISGNNHLGVSIRGSTSTDNILQGNYIGTDVTGAVGLANSFYGVFLEASPANNTIGGTGIGAGNTIAFNGAAGVVLLLDVGTGNAILSNAIFSNGNLGIDLIDPFGITGVTANDPGDGDTGPNNRQNFPVLMSAVTGGSPIVIGGTLDSAASTNFRVEFFANSACDPSGNGEGETFLGAATATTDAGGSADFSVLLTKAVSVGAAITATATDPNNNTSEFSACITAGAAAPVPGMSSLGLGGTVALLLAALVWTRRRHGQHLAASTG